MQLAELTARVPERLRGLSPRQLELLKRELRGRGDDLASLRLLRCLEPPRELPLSAGQRRLWVADRLRPGGTAYNLWLAFRLFGPLEIGCLEQAVLAVARRHEVLRTSFAAREPEPVQIVHRELRPGWALVDLSGLPDAVREEVLLRLGREQIARPFDLERGPLLRGVVLRLAAGEHAVLATIHHIVFDGWSAGLFLREVGALYTALLRGVPPRLPELPVQYGDFALWQRRSAGEEGLRTQAAYWREALHEAPRALRLPTDRSLEITHQPAGASVRVSLEPELARALREFARRQGVTVFTVLAAGFGVLLGRLAEQDDILLGTPVSLRDRRELEGLIGLLVNTLVLRLRLQAATAFRRLLDEVRDTILGAHAHQEVPFEEVLAEVFGDRSAFPVQVLFGLLSLPGKPLEIPGLRSLGIDLEMAEAPFPLALNLEDRGEGIAGRIDYRIALFDRTTIHRLARQLQTLLQGAVTAPDRLLGDLPLLSAGERHQVLQEWARTGEELPEGGLVLSLVDAWAAASPDAVAVASGERSLTYRELAAASESWARTLQRRGVGPEVVVGICADPCPELIVGLLAVLRAGGAYLPLETSWPRPRLAAMLEETRVPLLLTVRGLAEGLAPAGSTVLDLAHPPRREASALQPPQIEQDTLAYVIYTSGSTGRPKGVQLTHGGLCNLVREQISLFGVRPGDRVLQCAPLCFDASVSEIFMALAAGAELHLEPREALLPGGELADALSCRAISVLTLPPSLLSALPALEFPELRVLIVAGEVCPPDLIETWGRGRRLFNAYGPTEATVCATSAACEPGCGRAPIGRPLANTRAYVLTADLRPVPPGAVGELWLGGVALARGYFGRPDLTAERFVPDPVGDLPGGRLYRTGDLARFLADGRLECLGRRDHQVKIRGVRIEPGEIEAVLRRHPAVVEAAVLVDGRADRDRTLVAYVAAGGRETSPGDLRGFVAAVLPAAMVPSVVVVLAALPRTAQGKVDRAALAQIRPEATAATSRGEAPRTVLEGLLLELWAETLQQTGLGVDDDFFARGGDSIASIQIAARARKRGLALEPSRIFTAPTVRVLAAALEAERIALGLPARPEDPRAVQEPAETVFPLTPAQHGMLFFHLFSPASRAYFLQAACAIQGSLDAGALRRTWEVLLARHPALRASFVWDGAAAPSLRVPRDVELPWREEDWRGLSAESQRAAWERLLQEDREQGMDLSRAPVMRWALVRCGERSWRFLWTWHHILLDGWSVNVLTREGLRLYQDFRRGEEPDLGPAPSYAAYFTWLRRQDRARAEDFWRGLCAETPPAGRLPLDLGQAASPPAMQHVRSVHARVPSEALRAFAAAHGLTLSTLVQAAWGLLLSRCAGTDGVLFGITTSGRPAAVPDIEDLVGLFINTLPLSLRLPVRVPVLRWLLDIRDRVLAAREHEHWPLPLIQEWMGVTGPQPLCESIVIFQSHPARIEPPGGGAGFEVSEVQSFNHTSHPLVLLAVPGRDLLLEIAWDPGRFDAATVRRLQTHLHSSLEALISDPEAHLDGVDALPPAERQQLLCEWNDTAGDSEPLLIPQRFGRVAAARPEAMAVEGDGQGLTYGELSWRVSRLARRLRRLGVGPEARVGVLLDRDPDLVVALLAVIAAGGAYVPLDPADPAHRTAAVLEDSEASLLLTREPFADHAPSGRWKILRLAAEPPLHEEDPTLPALAGPDHLACVIYTSGTGGAPKGVMVRNGSLARYIEAAADRFGIGPADRVLQFARIGFDTSAEEILTCLTRGATLVLRRDHLAEAAPAFTRFCEEREITVLDLPTAYWSALTEGPGLAAARVPSSLRLVVIGGERASREALHRWRAWTGGSVRLINTYGPTEATIVTSWWELPPGDDPVPEVPIGRPVPGARIHLLDGRMHPVPAGTPGEVHIAGAGLARGYLGRPELTAERFIPDPFANGPGERLYRTGDLARRRMDGALEFLARLDRQVKIRGVRVEPEEVEAALLALPGVHQAVVAAHGEGADLHLVAYLVPQGGGLALDRLRDLLRERLPAPMLPSAFQVLERLPLTPNGKIDRQALAAPTVREPAAAAPPRTPVEEVVTQIWAEVLGREDVGVQYDFFAAGGHSLRAMQVVSRLRQAFGVELTVRELFEHPTVAGLAARVEEALRQGLTASLPPLVRAEPHGAARPLSYAQQGFWFLDRLQPGGIAYNVPMNARLPGPVDGAALDAALREIVRRHEILRTRYEEVDGVPVQVVGPAEGWPGLMGVDLTALPGRERLPEALRLAREEAATPFDLRLGPLFRARLLQLAPEDQWLVATVHHIACDEWSGRILLRELAVLYEACHRGHPSPLADLPVQYGDYAAWQRSWIHGELLAGQLAFWRRRLTGAPAVTALPVDRPRPPVQTFRGARRPVSLAHRVAEGLRALGSREGATPFMVGLALFQALLRRWSGSCDVSVGTPVSGRRLVEVEGVIGCFLNTLVLRVQGGEEASFLDLLRQVRERCLEAYANQDVPFEHLVEELAPQRSLSHSPLFQVMFVLLHGDAGAGSAAADPPMPAPSAAKLDLSLLLLATRSSLAGELEYNTDLFDEATAVRWCAALERLAEATAGEPERPLAEVGPLPEGQRRQLLADGPPSVPAAVATCMAVTPRDLLELELTWLWEDVLERGPIGVTDDFFALGGHSLLAVRLLALVRRRFGHELSLADLFRGATVERLAHLLRTGAGGEARRPLVAVRPAGDEPPLFWAHPVGGNVLCYAELARAMDPGLPVYAFQSPAREPGAPSRIEEMAELYLGELLALQPQGPYRLGGWSMGGLIAYEMAGRLVRQGRTVEMLALLDTHLPSAARLDPGDEAAWVAGFAQDLAGTLGRSLPVSALSLRTEDPLSVLFARLCEAGLVPASLGLDEIRELYGIFRANAAALAAYQPAPYPGRIFLVQAGGSSAVPRRDLAGAWAPLTGGGIENLTLAAGHYEILKGPAVTQVVRFLAGPLGRPARLPAQS